MFACVRSRNRAAAVFLIALAVFVPALVLPRSATDLTVRKLILFSSLPVMLISGVWLLVRWDEARRLMRLLAGQDVLARWTIHAAQWDTFRRHSSAWDQRPDIRPNDANLAQDPGAAGLEIVVTPNAILIGSDFWPLERDVRITVRADWMEFHQVIHKADGQPLHTVLRIPLQPGRENLAAHIEQAYQRARPAAGLGRHGLIYVALFCLVGLPAITALIWFLARLTGWVE